MTNTDGTGPESAICEELRALIIAEALAVCRSQRPSGLHRPGIAHLSGVLAARRGDLDLAIAYLTHAIRLDPTAATAFSDLAEAMLQKGSGTHALSAQLQAVRLDPVNPKFRFRLGKVLHELGRIEEAIAVFLDLLCLDAQDPQIHGALGDARRAQGRIATAAYHYLAAQQLAIRDAEWSDRLGRLWLDAGQCRQALTAFQRGLQIDPNRPSLHSGAGQALLQMGAVAHAAAAFQVALVLAPGDVAAHRHYVAALELLGRPLESVGAWVSLGTALGRQGRATEAVVAYRQALACQPDCLRAHLGLARAYMALGEAALAVEQFELTVAINPDRRDSRIELGLALQRCGDLERGWHELALYHAPDGPTWLSLEKPVWDGSPLNGRPVLLWAVAPPAEAVLFMRYAQFAKRLGGTVIVECDKTLVPLVQCSAGVDHVIATGAARLPFDVHAPVRYLPALVGPARSAVPADQPYIHPLSVRKRAWRQRLRQRSGALVGIAWAGGPEDFQLSRTTMSLSSLAQLRNIDGLRLISIQRGRYSQELLSPPPGLFVEQVLDDSCSLLDVAALIAQLDLVIATDSVVAHLAGALGIPVWTLLSRTSGWPWPLHGDRTMWYPTMRLFRQELYGSWKDVCVRVRSALETFVQEGSSTPLAPPPAG